MTRICILFDNLGPYHVARIRGASDVGNILAIEFGSRSGEYAWVGSRMEGAHAVINPDGPGSEMSAQRFRQRLFEVLAEFRPEVVVIPGWATRGAFFALEWAASNCVPVVIMSESTAWDESRIAWKEWLKRQIVSMASTALVGGHPHADYMQQLGMPSDRISLGYDAVDNAYFAAESERWRGQLSEAACPKYFLSSNRFIEKKNLFRLLEAYAAYGREFCDGHRPPLHCWDLVMLGDGELREKLLAHCEALRLNVAMCAPWEVEEKAESGKQKAAGAIATSASCEAKLAWRERSEGKVEMHAKDTNSSFQVSAFNVSAFLPPTVFFPGFRQIDELPRFYAHAGAFVHASTTEQWGLVVNEAMASGLPVIVSNRVGCATDLVQEGVNGFTFDPHDVEQLTRLLSRISALHFPVSTFGDASRAIISNWGPERFGAGLKAAADKALEVGPRQSTWIQKLLLEALIRK